jgi:hypothetical protein
MKKILFLADPVAGGNSSATDTVPVSLLREQLIQIFKLPANASDDDIAWAADTAQQYTVTTKAKLAEQAAEEMLIAEKMEVGLTRDQAVAVINRQRQHDAVLKRLQDSRRPRLLQIIKDNAGNLRHARAEARDELQIMSADEFNAALQEFQNQSAI